MRNSKRKKKHLQEPWWTNRIITIAQSLSFLSRICDGRLLDYDETIALIQHCVFYDANANDEENESVNLPDADITRFIRLHDYHGLAKRLRSDSRILWLSPEDIPRIEVLYLSNVVDRIAEILFKCNSIAETTWIPKKTLREQYEMLEKGKEGTPLEILVKDSFDAEEDQPHDELRFTQDELVKLVQAGLFKRETAILMLPLCRTE